MGLSPAAQLPRRDRGRHLRLQTRLWWSTLHLARARPLQGLHLVRRRRPQPDAVRPPEIAIARAPAGSGGRPGVLSGLTRTAIPSLIITTETRSRPASADPATSSAVLHC